MLGDECGYQSFSGVDTQVAIVHADLLELLLRQTDAFIDIRRRDERTVGVINLFYPARLYSVLCSRTLLL